MESKNLVICDPETKFASAFAQYLTRQKELAVRVRTCSDLSYVLAIQEKRRSIFCSYLRSIRKIPENR